MKGTIRNRFPVSNQLLDLAQIGLNGKKQDSGVRPSALPRSLIFFFFRLLPAEAPFFIFAMELIAIIVSLAKTIKVSFPQLFLVNDWRDDLSKAGIAQG
jgi:hypothetical protein